MTEKLLQYIWQFQYFNRDHLTTLQGEALQVIHAGQLNTNQGPDFLAARIKIENTVLAGSVELHIKTSDWKKHNHTTDANYNNVVLHVVYQNDEPQERDLPLLVLEERIPKMLLQKYEQLMNTATFIACTASVSAVKELTWVAWKERLIAERLTRKAATIFNLLEQSKQHWEEAFWWLLCRNFGGKVNGDAFEALAKSIPLNLLAKHKNSIHQLEALLFGQANLLNDHKDEYANMLQREYVFLQKKYKLKSIHPQVHFLRMRPSNFPTIRLAQLAVLVQNSTHLFSKILEETAVSKIKMALSATANDYWHYRYRFDEPTDYKPKKLGSDMAENILINTIIPYAFCLWLTP